MWRFNLNNCGSSLCYAWWSCSQKSGWKLLREDWHRYEVGTRGPSEQRKGLTLIPYHFWASSFRSRDVQEQLVAFFDELRMQKTEESVALAQETRQPGSCSGLGWSPSQSREPTSLSCSNTLPRSLSFPQENHTSLLPCLNLAHGGVSCDPCKIELCGKGNSGKLIL